MNETEILEAYKRNDGNKTATAQELGIHRDTVRKVVAKSNIEDKPLTSGSLKAMQPIVLDLPEPGKVKTYILSCVQNNTRANDKFLKNIEALQQWYEATRGHCEIKLSRITYNKSKYANAKSVKNCPNKEDLEECWYDRRVSKYFCDGGEHSRYLLAPGLQWCAEMNILPTAARPLNGLHTYTGADSAIFPHTKVALESGVVAKGDPPRFLYTTGAITQINYVQKAAGLKAEFHHAYAALLVEVDSKGVWFARHINSDSSGTFYDCPGILIKVQKGKVIVGGSVSAINWGDIHASSIDTDSDVYQCNWGPNGILDSLKPKVQFMHDTLTMESRGHHNRASWTRMYELWRDGQDSVEEEIKYTAKFLENTRRYGTETVVVRSNHDEHLERWLDEADYRKDPLNAEFFLEAQLARVRAMKARKKWMGFEWAVKRLWVSGIKFLDIEDQYILHNIQCGWHGHLGPNGSRGSTQALIKASTKINKGHDHTATIRDGIYSAGVCCTEQGYNKGPGSWSVSHIVTYPNGKRCIITMSQDGRWYCHG